MFLTASSHQKHPDMIVASKMLELALGMLEFAVPMDQPDVEDWFKTW